MNENDKKYKEYRKRKILKYSLIITSLFVIVLEILALFQKISYLWGLIPFVINCIIKYIYEKDNKKSIK